MAYNRSHARSICSDDELSVFLSSLDDRIKKLSVAELKQLIKRARTFRDKNQDLYRRQTLAIADKTGTKKGRTSKANDRTAQKVKLFAETIKRLEERLTHLA